MTLHRLFFIAGISILSIASVPAEAGCRTMCCARRMVCSRPVFIPRVVRQPRACPRCGRVHGTMPTSRVLQPAVTSGFAAPTSQFPNPFSAPTLRGSTMIWGRGEHQLQVAQEQLYATDPLTGRVSQVPKGAIVFEYPLGSRRFYLPDATIAHSLAKGYEDALTKHRSSYSAAEIETMELVLRTMGIPVPVPRPLTAPPAPMPPELPPLPAPMPPELPPLPAPVTPSAAPAGLPTAPPPAPVPAPPRPGLPEAAAPANHAPIRAEIIPGGHPLASGFTARVEFAPLGHRPYMNAWYKVDCEGDPTTYRLYVDASKPEGPVKAALVKWEGKSPKLLSPMDNYFSSDKGPFRLLWSDLDGLKIEDIDCKIVGSGKFVTEEEAKATPPPAVVEEESPEQDFGGVHETWKDWKSLQGGKFDLPALDKSVANLIETRCASCHSSGKVIFGGDPAKFGGNFLKKLRDSFDARGHSEEALRPNSLEINELIKFWSKERLEENRKKVQDNLRQETPKEEPDEGGVIS